MMGICGYGYGYGWIISYPRQAWSHYSINGLTIGRGKSVRGAQGSFTFTFTLISCLVMSRLTSLGSSINELSTRRSIIRHQLLQLRSDWQSTLFGCRAAAVYTYVGRLVIVVKQVFTGHNAIRLPSFTSSSFVFLLFPFFHWLYLFSSFVHPFPFYQSSPTPFPGWRS